VLPYQRALAHAEVLLRSGNSAGAIDPLRDALTAAPEEAYPHLLLARALREQHRLVGARHEAERAIELAPTWALPRVELAQTLVLQQHSKAALAAAEQAIELEPEDADAHLVRAMILRNRGRRGDAQASLATALKLDPSSPAAMAERGFAALERGEIDVVEASGREAFEAGRSDGLVLLGHAMLARGDSAEALRLALDALARSPNNLEALHLLASAKMKRNPIGGLWWRWNRLLVKLGQARAIFFVVGVWVAYRWAVVASIDWSLDELMPTALSLVYLMFVIYTLSADAIVRRMIANETRRVRIRPEF
jgi:Flp pilus assembly protein TadD